MTIQKTEDHIFSSENQGRTNYFINPKTLIRLMVKSQILSTRWDYLSTFKPPERLSIEAGHTYYEKAEIYPGTTEFEFVASRFTSTFNGRMA